MRQFVEGGNNADDTTCSNAGNNNANVKHNVCTSGGNDPRSNRHNYSQD